MMTGIAKTTGEEGLRRLRRLAEGVVLTTVCAAPWMLGSVQAWSEFVLILGIGIAALLVAISSRHPGLRKNVFSVPSLALGGLILLGAFQSLSIPAAILRGLDPSAGALRADLLPAEPERIAGDRAAPVPLPSPTLSQEPGATRDATVRLLAAWLLFQAVVGLGGGYDGLRRFAWVIAANATLLALFALIQALTWNGKIYWIIPATGSSSAWSVGGPFVCHTHLAEYLNVGLGFGLSFLLGGLGSRHAGRGIPVGRGLAAYVVGVLVLGIITSHSRGGFLAMLAAAAFTIVCLRTRRLVFWGGLLAALAILAAFLVAIGDPSSYVARLETILDSGDEGYRLRTAIWRDVLFAVRSHPLWGTGLGTFGTSAAAIFRRDHGSFAMHAENEYVEMLLEGGSVGFVLAIVGVFGVGWNARRAWLAAPSHADRALVVGAFAGVVALACQCFSDFGLHIPGVSLLLVAVCGHLSRLGASESSEERAEAPISPRSWIRLASIMATVAIATLPAAQAFRWVRCEALVASAGLPAPDTYGPTPILFNRDPEDLDRMRLALEEAVRQRPNWTEGHLRLGLANLSLYRATAADWLSDTVSDPAERAQLADPLWLLALVREGKADPDTLAEQDPVHRFLVPAARSFQEARRACLVSALAHAELGGLACLFKPTVSSTPYVDRALETSGANSTIILFAADVAVLSGDPLAAARCWRRALLAGEGSWQQVADSVPPVLTPEQILERVIPENRGRYALLFAERLYSGGDDRAIRDRFLHEAVARLPRDRDLPRAERLWLEGRALSLLDDREPALRQMEAALVLEPKRFEWWSELIGLLVSWGKPEEAHQQALFALHLSPANPEFRKLVEQTAEAVARGADSVPPPADSPPSR